MTDAPEQPLPPQIERVLRYFRAMGREEKMQALVQYARKLEPLPERFRELDRTPFNVPECQTRVDVFPEVRDVNGQPPETTLAIPNDFVRQVMDGIGLAARETGLTALLLRLKRNASDAAALR